MEQFLFSKDNVKKELEKALEIYKERLVHIRTGQASPALVENINVTYQGFEMKLQELASIRLEGLRALVIEPWDKGSTGNIEKALLHAKRNFNPQIRANTIYLNFPSLTEEMRRDAVKEIKEMKEEARVKIRLIRDDWWEKIKKAEDEGEIREDAKFRFKDDLQKLVDEYTEKIEETTERKIKSLV